MRKYLSAMALLSINCLSIPHSSNSKGATFISQSTYTRGQLYQRQKEKGTLALKMKRKILSTERITGAILYFSHI